MQLKIQNLSKQWREKALDNISVRYKMEYTDFLERMEQEKVH